MVLLGAIVNGIAIIAGTLLGKLLERIPESMKNTVMQAIGLALMLLGVQMGLKSGNFLIVILSLVIGAVAGEWINIEGKFTRAGDWLERRVGAGGQGSISLGFVTASLVFVVGAMAILGALDSGIKGNHEILYAKSIMDGFIAIILTSTLGIGVMFSAIPVVMYQGAIALLATQITRFVPYALLNDCIAEMTATGGVMIIGIGLNLLGITKIKVANLLPGILMAVLLVVLVHNF
ncbi:DUF554 domain-containing protein [Paenibacillus sp. FSL R7-0337]|uniref:DUF554 domain-containing protein n=1 Tax=unclassified Paenibacillus TaxID=185978 RepID=UPI00096C260E|nr:DUF554 domain-containing protein [Paenibacillus sp. FSL R7-0337]OMF86856.1 hypothetical protein BK147_29635 [Paenibacillus sp. FSL R7-0337]